MEASPELNEKPTKKSCVSVELSKGKVTKVREGTHVDTDSSESGALSLRRDKHTFSVHESSGTPDHSLGPSPARESVKAKECS